MKIIIVLFFTIFFSVPLLAACGSDVSPPSAEVPPSTAEVPEPTAEAPTSSVDDANEIVTQDIDTPSEETLSVPEFVEPPEHIISQLEGVWEDRVFLGGPIMVFVFSGDTLEIYATNENGDIEDIPSYSGFYTFTYGSNEKNTFLKFGDVWRPYHIDGDALVFHAVSGIGLSGHELTRVS